MSKRQRKSKTSPAKNVQPKFMIFTEGKETEPLYIKGYIEEYLLQNNCFGKVLYAFKPKNHTPKGLFDNAKKSLADKVWIVFDRDGHPYIPETFAEASRHDVEIAFSSISFETWILLHFEYTTKQYAKCEDLTSDSQYLKKYISDYDKALPELFCIATKDGGLSKAIKNAEKLCKNVSNGFPEGTPIYNMNPYTNFYRLLDAIDDFFGIDKDKKRA
jgi:hypothetical protein